MRYENKYRITERSYAEIKNILHYCTFQFREIYHKRIINNLYLDTFELSNYFDNIDGNNEREKIRIRWYGNSMNYANNPKLEFKIKRGHVSKKNIINLNNFIFKNGFSREDLVKVLRKSSLSNKVLEKMCNQRLSLFNKYERQYYISSNGHYRITLDKDMEYYNLNDYSNYFITKRTDYGVSVMEIKYDPVDRDGVSEIIDQFPFRLAKNSKYVTGVTYFIQH